MADIFVTRLNSFAHLNPHAVHAAADAVSRTLAITSGQDVVRAGETSSECHVVLSGMAAHYKLLSDGKRQIVRFSFPGDLLDLDGFIGRAMDHSVVSCGPCTVGIISHQTLHELSAAHPEIATALWRHTLADAAVFREWVVNVGQRPAQVRIAHLLCEVCSRLNDFGDADDAGSRSFSWHLTQQDLADATGLSCVHVNRCLQELRARGLIEITRENVTIHNWRGLKSLAGFNADYLLLPETGRRSLTTIQPYLAGSVNGGLSTRHAATDAIKAKMESERPGSFDAAPGPRARPSLSSNT